MAEDPSRILVGGVNSMGSSISNYQPVLKPTAHKYDGPSKNLPTTKQPSVVLPALESHSQGPPASEGDSAIFTLRSFAAPLSPCLIPSALVKEGSRALDLTRTIHEDIRRGRCECLICTDNVGPVSRPRSCQICGRALHLSCVQRWVRAESSPRKLVLRDVLEGWRCPSCNPAQIELPGKYTCWCGKQEKPRPLLGLPPHSCGRACSRVSVGRSCCNRPCKFICHAGPCSPCGHEEPLQGISDQSSEDKPPRPRSRRTFEEMDESIITHPSNINSAIIIADEDEPPLKKHKGAMILGINSPIKITKAELVDTRRGFRDMCETGVKIDDRSWGSWNQLGRQRTCSADVRRYVLDRETEPSGLHDTPLSAIHGLITENKGEMAKVMREFHHMHKGGQLDYQSEVLLGRYSSLESQHVKLMEIQKYILDFAFPARVKRND